LKRHKFHYFSINLGLINFKIKGKIVNANNNDENITRATNRTTCCNGMKLENSITKKTKTNNSSIKYYCLA